MDFQLISISKESLEWQCSVLKFAGFTVLLNCGWTESFDTELLSPLIPFIGELDLILLTHADTKHLGAVPYLLSKYPVTCPVVCTEPVCRLGELACVACLEDREKYRETADACDVDDILRIFMSRLTPLKYRETFPVQARGRSLGVCPYPAGGHMGSAYWTIQSGSLTVAYIVDCDLRHSRYLEGMDIQRLLPVCRGAAQRWDAVITSPLADGLFLPHEGSLQVPEELHTASKALTVARTVREQVMLEETISTLRQGGTVLIPADVVGWIPEVLLLLEAAWAKDRHLATHYPLVWLSSMGDMVLDQIKTRLEYMSREVLQAFEARFGSNPFVLKNVRIFQTLEELCNTHPLSRPKVILTTSAHLEGGDSRELFLRLCGDPRTLVWLLGVPPSGTFARQLLNDFVLGSCSRKDYRMQHYLKQALPDEELRAYYEAKLQEHELEREVADLGGASVKVEASDRTTGTTAPAATNAPASNPLPRGATAEPAEPLPSPSDGKLASHLAEALRSRLPMKDAARGAAVSSSLWSPLGWPSSRTLAHNEWRTEGDEYGHRLTAAELRSWRAQDQEGNKYSGQASSLPGATAPPTGAEDPSAPTRVKEESFKAEDEAAYGIADGNAEWREALRLHFKEPMRCEVREKTVRVVCRIRYIPDRTLDSKDLLHLLQLMGPRHVVFLPSGTETGTAKAIEHLLHNSRLASGTEGFAAPPDVHALTSKDFGLTLPLQNLKRRVQLSSDLWPKLTFQKIADGIRVARVRAVTLPPQDGMDSRILELDVCDAGDEPLLALPAPPASDGQAKVAQHSLEEGRSASSRLPRNGALFIGTGLQPLTLSGLKDVLRTSEWGQDEVEVEFRPLAASRRPWSSRILAAGGGKAALGWPEAARKEGGGREGNFATLRLEGAPSEEFFMARAALYKRCAVA